MSRKGSEIERDKSLVDFESSPNSAAILHSVVDRQTDDRVKSTQPLLEHFGNFSPLEYEEEDMTSLPVT